MRHLSTILLFLLFIQTSAGLCQVLQHAQLRIETPAGAKPWTARAINDKPGQFQFAIVTDRTGGHRVGVFEDAVKKINLLQPEFVMSVGDLIEGYTTDTLEINRQWDEFCGFVDQLTMPFFFVPGNHDLTNPVMEKIWERRFGLKNYSFVYKDVLFMALNSEDQTRGSGKGSISNPQLDWIKATLTSHPDVKWTFLFMHQPLWIQETDPEKWFEVEKLLEGRRHTVFAGHRHNYVKYKRNNTNYYMLATTGGGSPLRGPQLGEFDHFLWVTMTEQGPILANLQLEGVFDDNLRTEEHVAFANKIWTSDIIRVEPLYIPDQSFKSDSVRLKFTNPFDVPVRIKLSKGFSWDIKADLPTPEITVAPNSVAYTSMEMVARKQKPVESMEGVRVKAEVAVSDDKGHAAFFVPFEFNVAPLKRYELVKANKPVSVDGNLKDWKMLPYTVSTKEGASFGIMHDDNFLYLGVQVNDSEIIANAADVTFNQDFIGFLIDGQPTQKSAHENGEEWFANSLYFITGPQDKSGQNSVWDMSDFEKSLSWKCIKNEKGYAFELAVPLSYIKKQQGDNWQTIRVNVVVQDKDKNPASSSRVTWQPDWRNNSNVIGSGMFFRALNSATSDARERKAGTTE